MSKTILHPETGKTYKLGRLPPKPSEERAFHIPVRRFLRRNMPKRPTKTNYAAKAMDCLRQGLCNDSLSCCTASGAFHIEGVLRGNAGIPVRFSDDQVITFYSATTGYVRGDEKTDQGGDEVTVLDWWRTHGLYTSGRGITKDAAVSRESHPIAGHLCVDATNPDEIKDCLWLFENCYAGWSCPDAWVNPPPASDGFVWDIAAQPVEDNGHCTAFVDYDDSEDGFRTSTWGLLGLTTTAATAKYGVPDAGGELHAVISQDALIRATEKVPSGFDWEALVNEFAARGGNIPKQLQHMIG